jgi:drug/metabolite transporter (DMT)-like permease
MNKILEIGLIIVAVSAVAIADVFIKKATSVADNFKTVLKNPLMLAVLGLYLIQILIFTYVFVKKAELGAVGIIQTALYAVIVIGSGIIFFKEEVSLWQGIGMALAIIGVIVINLSK